MPSRDLPPLPSPCKGICQLDASGEECLGCLRTPKQISDWPRLDNTGRLAILEELKAKRRARGGVVRRRTGRRQTTSQSL